MKSLRGATTNVTEHVALASLLNRVRDGTHLHLHAGEVSTRDWYLCSA